MNDLVTIATFTGPLEAHIAKGRLEAEGIPVFIAHEHHIWAKWFLSNALGGVKLQVLKIYQNEAQTIIKSHINGEYEDALKYEFNQLESNICPKCRSGHFKSKFPPGLIVFVILTLGLFGFIFPLRREIHICQHCGNKWKF